MITETLKYIKDNKDKIEQDVIRDCELAKNIVKLYCMYYKCPEAGSAGMLEEAVKDYKNKGHQND